MRLTLLLILTLLSGCTHKMEAPATAANPFQGQNLYVWPDSDAAKWEREHRFDRPEDAKSMDKIAQGATTQWFGDWNHDVAHDLGAWIDQSQAAAAVPVFVLYNIPSRDKGEYSAGGKKTADGYMKWIAQVAQAVGSRNAIVLLEPDALAQLDRLTADEQNERCELLRNAIVTLSSLKACSVYVDAGHPGWKTPDQMAERLRKAGINKAEGFCLNISNFSTDETCLEYGEKISSLVGRKHFVIDRGRNGAGVPTGGAYCNPPGMALGKLPTTRTGNPIVDAFLWVKTPSASDGNQGGAPVAGKFYEKYSLELAKKANW